MATVILVAGILSSGGPLVIISKLFSISQWNPIDVLGEEKDPHEV